MTKYDNGFHDRDPDFPKPEMAGTILARHGRSDDGAADWMRLHGLPPAPEAVTMRGGWRDALGFRHPATFWPFEAGPARAIALPIKTGDATVDILVIDMDEPGLWGVVTGALDLIGAENINATRDPLHVYETPMQWLGAGRTGVLPLRKAGYTEIRYHYPMLVARNWDHAEAIIEWGFSDRGIGALRVAVSANKTALTEDVYDAAASILSPHVPRRFNGF